MRKKKKKTKLLKKITIFGDLRCKLCEILHKEEK